MYVKIKFVSFQNGKTVYMCCIFDQFTGNLNNNGFVYQ